MGVLTQPYIRGSAASSGSEPGPGCLELQQQETVGFYKRLSICILLQRSRMSELWTVSRTSFLLIWVLVVSSMASGFPQPRLPLRDPDDPQEAKQDDWDVLFPSVSLHDWNVQMMRAAADSKAGLMREAWLFAPQRTEDRVDGVWPVDWASEGARLMKRNMVVADDAAFREKSKMLTSMERQKWLNSYMQKLLVVNS